MKGIKLWLGIIQIILLSTLLLFAVLQNKIHFEADLLSLLPSHNQPKLIQQAEKWFFNQYKNSVFITLSGPEATKAYDQLQQLFTQENWLDTRVHTLDINQVTEFYTQFKGALLTPSYRALLQQPAQLTTFVSEKLTSTADPFVSASFNHDPSLSIAEFSQQQLSQSVVMNMQQGRLILNQTTTPSYLLLLQLPKESTSLLQAQTITKKLLNYLQQSQQQYQLTDIVYSGIIFHTAENTTQAEFEMTFLGGVSLLGLLLIVTYVFRSFAPIIGSALTVANAILAGLVALIWIFPSVHLLSLIFGVTLIGIAIDYSFHVMADHISFPEKDITAKKNTYYPLLSVNQAIIMGFITTALGYLVFAFTPLGIMPQIAVFVIAGLAGALMFALLVLPSMMLNAKPLQIKPLLLNTVIKKLRLIRYHSNKIILFLLLIISINIIFLPLEFNDDIRLLNASSQTLLTNESINQQRLKHAHTQRFYITAKSFEQLMQQEEAISDFIHKRITNTVVVSGLSHWIPSIKKQQNNFLALSAAEQAGVFQSLSSLLDYPVNFQQPNYLDKRQLKQSPLALIINNKLFEHTLGYVSLLEVKNIIPTQQNELIEVLTQQYPNQLFHIDKAKELTKALNHFREQLYWGFSIIFLVVTILFILHFGVMAGLFSGGILFLVSMLSLQLSIIIQQTLNIFNVLAMMLILALAIDYLIFYRQRGIQKANVIAISLSAASSIIVFGILSFSQTPAVFSFGLTVLFGIIFIYLLSPLIAKEHNE